MGTAGDAVALPLPAAGRTDSLDARSPAAAALAAQRRLLRAVTAMAVLLLLGSVAWILWRDRQDVLDTAAALGARRAARLAEELTQTLDLAKAAIELAEARLQRLPAATPPSSLAEAMDVERDPLLALLPLPFELRALDRDGRVIELAPSAGVRAHEATLSAAAMLAAPAGAAAAWQVGVPQGAAGARVVPLLRTAAANRHGVAAFAALLAHAALVRRFEGSRLQQGGEVALFRIEADGSSTLLARAPAHEAGLGQPVRWPQAALLADATRGTFDADTPIDQTRRLVAYQRLEGEAANLLVTYGVATESLLAGWHARLPWVVAIALLLAGGVAWGGRRLDRSMQVLATQQQALERSESHFRALSDSLPDVVARLDREGRHLYVNVAVVQATGLPPEAFIGRTNAELGMPEQTVAMWMATLARVFDGGHSERLQFEYPGPRGLRHWESEVALEPAVAGTPRTVVVISRDVTERVQAETARQSLDRQLVELLEGMSDGFVSLGRDWCYRYLNHKAGELLGREPASLIGKHIWTEFPEGLDQPFHRAYERAMNEGVSLRLEEHYAPSDAWFENRIHPTADGISIFFTDITERMHAMHALRDSEARHREMFESNPQPMWVYDLQTLAFLAVNDAAVRQYGYSRDEFLGLTIKDIRPREDVARLLDNIAHVTAGVDAAGGWRHLTKDGRLLEVEITSHTLQFDGRAAELVLAHDVTRRNQLERTLSDSEARLAHLLRKAPTVIYTARAEGDFAATYYSPTLHELLGWSPEQFLQDAAFWLDHVHPDDRDRVLRELDALHTRDDLVLEYRFQHVDGRWRWMRDAVSVVRADDGRASELVGSWIDITARREAEDQVRQLAAELEQRVQDRTAQLATSEARYRAIFDTVPVAIGEEDWSGVQRLLRGLRAAGVSDGAGYFAAHPGFVRECLRAVRIRRLNRSALVLHDARDQETELPDLQAFYPAPEDLPQFVGELEALWAGQRVYTAKKALASVSGRPLHLMVTISLPALDDADGTALTCLVDIGEIDRLNAELDRSVHRLRQVNKELETFTYSVSHDLKAPLRGIDGYSRLLLTEHPHQLDDEGRQFLSHIRQATQHMGVLIDDLLAYSRLERRELTMASLPLATLVERVLSPYRLDFTSLGVALAVDVPADLHALGDAQGLTIALRNLIDNALKFSRDSRPPRIEVSGTRAGPVVRLAVRDNGLGFDMKFHDRIFAVFQRLHRAEEYPGTGVGLAIVRKAMERMGGRVWADSAPGCGATFTLELPEAT